jgi:hypothetical protein
MAKYTDLNINPQRQKRCSGGYIDISTNNHIIEIKLYSKWRLAIGQLLSYHIGNEDKTMKLILFGTPPTAQQISHIERVCTSIHIDIEYYNT